MMKLKGNFFIGLALLLIYFLVFPRQMEKELTLIPERNHLLAATRDYDDSRGLWKMLIAEGFQPGEQIFVLAKDGRRVIYADEYLNTMVLRIGRNFAAGSNWLAAVSENNYLQLEYTDKPRIIKTRILGMPVARGGNLFVYDYFSGQIQLVDRENGQISWSREYISPVTVLDHKAGHSLIAFLNGYLVLLDQAGKTILEYELAGSQVNPIYGATLSEDSSRIALLGGMNPQRLLYMKRNRQEVNILEDYPVKTMHRGPALILFVRKGAYSQEILYAGVEQVNNYSRSNVNSIGMAGQPIAWIDKLPGKALALMHSFRSSSPDKRVSLNILTKNNQKLFRSELPSESLVLSSMDSKLILLGSSILEVANLSIW